MSEAFKISCAWLGPSHVGEDTITRSCRASIKIEINGRSLTRLEDTRGNTVRDHFYANAYTLGAWLTANWWRLRHQPEVPYSKDDIEWRMSHSLASAGEGYCWPSLLFANEGNAVKVTSRASEDSSMGPVRYLTHANVRIKAESFERGVDAFMSQLLSRLHGEGHCDSELEQLWTEVQMERSSEVLSRHRRLEAICGYDPEEAPGPLLEALLHDSLELGSQALEEVASHSQRNTLRDLDLIKKIASQKGKPEEGAFSCHPMVLSGEYQLNPELPPWQRGATLANAARHEWDLGTQPVPNDKLALAMNAPKKSLENQTSRLKIPMPLFLRNTGNVDSANIYIASHWETSRRFATCRFLGSWLEKAGDTERLIPASDAGTPEQQFQRAFAQEFLCPYEGLLNRLQTEKPSDDDILDAAEHFGVSEYVVRTTLVNRGDLAREALPQGE